MKIKKTVVAGTLALGVAGFSQLSMATTSASASATATGSPTVSSSKIGGNGQTASASAIATAPAGIVANATASASAAEGLLNVAFDNYVSGGPGSNARGDSYARASWNDSLTIGAGSAMLGQSGHVMAMMNFLGTYGGALGPIGQWDSAEHYEGIKILGTGIVGIDPSCRGWSLCAYQDVYTWGPTRSHSSITSVITLDIPVIFGAANGIAYTLDLTGLAMQGNTFGVGTWAHASANVALAWGGITGVYDARGNAVTNFTATSASGLDYYRAAVPVPEPETYAMLLAGLGLLGLTARRRRRN